MPASAEPIATIVSHVGAPNISGVAAIELLVANTGDAVAITAVAAALPADLATIDGVHRSVTLIRALGQAARVRVAPGGFAQVHYRLALPAGTAAGTLLLTLPGAPSVAMMVPEDAGRLAAAAMGDMPPPPAPIPAEPRTAPGLAASDRGGNAFLPNLSTYQPIYAVYGPGTNTDARLQISFKYQLFGRVGDTDGSWLDGITFGYTQRMFWDLGRNSSPFRDVDYMPELLYLVPPRAVGGGIAVGGQAGVQHQSNGSSGDASRSLNMLYIQPVATMPLGDWKLVVGPKAWVYLSTTGNPRIGRYRGNTGLFAQIGQDDGLRLSATGRINPGSGKGAIDAELSYPVARLVGGVNLYLMAQGFSGYGENLLDYDRQQTRLRAGFAVVR